MINQLKNTKANSRIFLGFLNYFGNGWSLPSFPSIPRIPALPSLPEIPDMNKMKSLVTEVMKLESTLAKQDSKNALMNNEIVSIEKFVTRYFGNSSTF